jgi:hypothetical protein
MCVQASGAQAPASSVPRRCGSIRGRLRRGPHSALLSVRIRLTSDHPRHRVTLKLPDRSEVFLCL